VSPTGGKPEVVVSLDEGQAAQSPQMLPGGTHLLFTLATGGGPDRWDKALIVAQSLATGERTTLIEGGTDARYLPTGHIVYAVRGNLLAIPFDARRLELHATPVLMVEGVARGAAGATGTAHYGVAANGTLVYIAGPVAAPLGLGLSNRQGAIEPLNLPPGAYDAPRVSPDGTRIAFGTDDGHEAIVWVYDLSGRAPMRRLTFDGNNRFPTWTADSARIAFQSDRDGDLAVFWQLAAGGVAERLTTPAPGEAHEPESWSPDGVLLFNITKGSDVSLWMLSTRDGNVAPFGTVHSLTRTGAVFSSDGRWVAYASSGRPSNKTIYVEPFPPTGVKHQLLDRAAGQPNHPAWSPDGAQLFYNPGPGRFEAVSVTTTPALTFGNPLVLHRSFPGASLATRRPFDVMRDGRILSTIVAGQAEPGRPFTPRVQVVLNWFEELKARAR
jgi:hypothetical protein